MADLLSYALTSVADVKESLGIASGDSSKNNIITRKINQATEIIEGYCNRRFKATDYTEYYDGSLGDQLVLRHRPVNSVTTLSVRISSINEDIFDVIDPDQYFIDTTAGILDAVDTFYGSYNRWKIVYNAGYTTIPADLAEAAATLAAFMVENGGTGQSIKRKKKDKEK